MNRFITVDRQTTYLLPPSVDEWLPANHLARFVVEVIEQLDHDTLATFCRRFLKEVGALFVRVQMVTAHVSQPFSAPENCSVL